jgi:hypothetical protein
VSVDAPRNLRTDFAAIHVDRKVAVAADAHGGLRLVVRWPAKPPCSTDRRIWGSDIDVLAFRKQLAAGLPYRIESIDQVIPCSLASAALRLALLLANSLSNRLIIRARLN